MSPAAANSVILSQRRPSWAALCPFLPISTVPAVVLHSCLLQNPFFPLQWDPPLLSLPSLFSYFLRRTSKPFLTWTLKSLNDPAISGQFFSSLFSLCSTWRPLSPSFKAPHRSHPAVKETTRSLLTLQLSTFAVQLSPLLSQVGAHTDSVGGRLKPAQKVKGLPTGSGPLLKSNNKKTQICRVAEELKLTLTWRAIASPSVVSSWQKTQQTHCRCWRMRVGLMALWHCGCSSHPSTPSGEPAWP